MAEVSQLQLVPAGQVAREVAVRESQNGICYAAYGDTLVTDIDLERIVQAVPPSIAAALKRRAWYFVPLAIGEGEETLVSPGYTTDLGDRATCHRNVRYAGSECVFISSRLLQDRFALSFEFFINAGHAFVDETGVPQTFSDLLWKQAVADVRGETSHDAWESRHKAMGHEGSGERNLPARVDEKAKTAYFESAFADAVAIYLLSLTVDFEYADLREREYPLLAPQQLAERLRAVAELFPPNPGYEFAVLYRKRP
jgi:hypothetical protein